MQALLEGILRHHSSAWSQEEVPDVDLMARGLVLVVTGQCRLGIVGGQRLSCIEIEAHLNSLWKKILTQILELWTVALFLFIFQKLQSDFVHF